MKNGLYSIHVSLQDGRSGKGSGVVLFRDGKILGGDAYLFYVGSYTVKGDTFKGGVSGTFTDRTAVMDGTALVGKASQIFKATLRFLAEAD